jgi:hypothetical protein
MKRATSNSTNPEVQYWFRVASQDPQSLSLVWTRPDHLLIELFLVFFSIIWTAGWGLGAFVIPQDMHGKHLPIWVILLLSAGIMIGLYFITLTFRSSLNAAITEVRFLLDEKATILTYLFYFKRRISDLPSAVEITSSNMKGCYHGRARLRLGNSRTHIYFLTTCVDFDNDSDATRCATEAAAEICEQLQIKTELTDNQPMSAKGRCLSLLWSLCFVAVSCWLFYLALGPGRNLPNNQDHIEYSASQLGDRILFGGLGVFVGAIAALGIFATINPNWEPRKRKSVRQRRKI